MRRLRSLRSGVYFFIILSFLLTCVLPAAVWAAPTVSITNPQDGAQVNGQTYIDVSFKAEQGLPVTSILLFVDGKQVQQWSLATPKMQGEQSFPWDFSLSAGATHIISARAVDAQGQTGNATITVHVQQAQSAADLLPPVITIYYPAHGAKVAGAIKIKANATDNDTVASVFFYVDGKFKTMIMNAPPYVTDLDTSKLPDGPHVLSASAFDRADNEGKSPEVTIFVANKEPGAMTMGEGPVPGSAVPALSAPGVQIPQVIVPPTSPVAPAGMAQAPHAQSFPGALAEAMQAPPVVAPPAQPAAYGSDVRTATPAYTGQAPSGGVRSGHGPGLSATGPRMAGVPSLTPPPPMAVASPRTPPQTGAGPALEFSGQTLAALPNAVAPVHYGTRVAEPTRVAASVSAAALAPAAVPGPGPSLAALPSATSTPSLPVTPARRPQTGASLGMDQAQQVTGTSAASLALSGTRTSQPAETWIAQTKTSVGAPPMSVTPKIGLALADNGGFSVAMLPSASAGAWASRVDQPSAGVAPPTSAAPAAIAKIRGVQILFNGQKLDLRALPESVRGISMAPLREIFEKTDGSLYWYPTERRVRAVNDQVDLTLVIGQRQAKVNDHTQTLSLAPFLKNGRTMVPLQFIADTLKVSITYNPDSGQIVITSNEF